MSQLPAMPVWWADFFNKTDHLSNEEQWAYMKLLAKTWARNAQPIPDKAPDIARALGLTVRRWLKVRPRIAPFFDLSGGTWRQKNLEKQFAFVAERVEISRRNGKRGGRPLSNKNNDIENPEVFQQEPVANPEQTRNETTHTQSQRKKDSEAKASGADAPRDPAKEMWDRGKAVLGKSAGSLIGQALKAHKQLAVMEAIIATEEANAPDPVAFFIGCLRSRANGKRSPVEKLYAGAMAAADAITARQMGQSEEPPDSGLDKPPALTLLDGGRSRAGEASPDRGLADCLGEVWSGSDLDGEFSVVGAGD